MPLEVSQNQPSPPKLHAAVSIDDFLHGCELAMTKTELMSRLPESWKPLIVQRLGLERLERLSRFEAKERSAHDVFPPAPLVFHALERVAPPQVRCVILGQDPYHDDGQAHGIAFSVPSGVKFPPSLRNILTELQSDIGATVPSSGDLGAWLDQGVLLLNTVLTVRAHEPLSHRKSGWEEFTDAVIDIVAAQTSPTAFVLWGNPAQEKASRISTPPHLVHKSVHPSPLSARRGFFGSKPFSTVNRFLNEKGRGSIDWNLAPR